MIAVVVADDGLHFKVVTQNDHGEVVNVTEEYKIHPMAIEVDGEDIIGFHIGFVKPKVAEAK